MVIAAVLVALALIHATVEAGAQGRFDRHFRQASKQFFGRALAWQWFKAQAMAESSLRPEAVSPAGARGLMQLMVATGEEQAGRLGLEALLYDPRTNITLGVFYDRQLWGQWRAERPAGDRIQFMLASYNAGLGNILKAQRAAKERGDCNSNLWACVAEALPSITGRHSTETTDYVWRIETFYKDMISGVRVGFSF